MGKLICNTHGPQFLSTVSEAVSQAVRDQRSWSADEIVEVQCDWFEEMIGC